jgi:hypothetical protein
MTPETPAPSRVPPYDPWPIAGATLCCASLFFDTVGWLMAIAGVFLLRRGAFRASVKWLLAAIALAPKILFLGVRLASPQPGLSFAIEPTTLTTSSSLWVWSVLLAALGLYLAFWARPAAAPPGAPPQTETRLPLLLKVLGLVAIAGSVNLLLGLTDGFHRIDDAGDGRWALRHAVRGTRATFTRADVASIEVTENHSSRGSSSYTFRVGLSDGRTYAVTSRSFSALRELRAFATTADLRPGTVRVALYHENPWTNGASGFALKDVVGTYENLDSGTGDRTTIEFWKEGDRLAGKETLAHGTTRHIRTLRNIRVSEVGELAFEPTTIAEVGKPSNETMSFSFSWSPTGETGRLTKDGLTVGATTFARR